MQPRRAVTGLLAVAALAVVTAACTPPICFGDALELQDITWTRAVDGTTWGEVEGYLYHKNCGAVIDYVEVWAWFYDAEGRVVHKAWTNMLDVRPNERRYWRILYQHRPEYARVDVRWVTPW